MKRLVFSALFLIFISHTAFAQDAAVAGLSAPAYFDGKGTGGPVSFSWTLFATIFTAVHDPMQTAVQTVATALIGWLAPQMMNLITLAYLLTLLAGLLDHIDSPSISATIVQGFRTLYRGAFVASIIATFGNFQQIFLQPFLNFPTAVNAAVLGAVGGDPNVTGGAVFDTLFNHTIAADFKIATGVSFFTLEGLAAGIVVLLSAIFSGLFIGYTFFQFLIAFVQFFLVMSIAPLFIPTLIFRFTRQFFSGWLSAAVSSAMVIIMISVLLAIAIKVQQQQIDLVMNAPANANKWGLVTSSIGMLIVTFLTVVATLKIDAWAVGLAGGVYQATNTYMAAAPAAAEAAWNAVSGMFGGGGGGAGAGAAAGGAGGGGAAMATPAGAMLGGASPARGFGARPRP